MRADINKQIGVGARKRHEISTSSNKTKQMLFSSRWTLTSLQRLINKRKACVTQVCFVGHEGLLYGTLVNISKKCIKGYSWNLRLRE